MQKIKRNDQSRQDIHRAMLEAYNQDGVIVARRVYANQTGCTAGQAKVYIQELVDFLETEDKKKVSKGACNVDNLMFLLVFTEEEEQELEKQDAEFAIKYDWSACQSRIKELKEDALRDIRRIQDDIDKLKSRLEASIDRPTVSFFDSRMTSRGHDLDNTMCKLSEKTQALIEMKYMFEAVEKLTGLDIVENGDSE